MRRVSELDDDSENDIEIGDHADDEVLLPSTTRDVDLEDEMGFSILMMIRGRNTGRRVKRDLCCFGSFQFIVGVALAVIADAEDGSYPIKSF